jgi:hypothetical protein
VPLALIVALSPGRGLHRHGDLLEFLVFATFALAPCLLAPHPSPPKTSSSSSAPLRHPRHRPLRIPSLRRLAAFCLRSPISPSTQRRAPPCASCTLPGLV